MQKYVVLSLAVIVLLFILIACGEGASKEEPGGAPGPAANGKVDPGKDKISRGLSDSDLEIIRNLPTVSPPEIPLNRRTTVGPLVNPADSPKTIDDLFDLPRLTDLEEFGKSFQEFVIEVPAAPPPPPEKVILGPGDERGILMPGGLNDRRIPTGMFSERFELDIQPNWLYVFDFQPSSGAVDSNLCFAVFFDAAGGQGSEACVGPSPDRLSKGPWFGHTLNPGFSYFEFSDFPGGEAARYVLTVTGVANDHGNNRNDPTPVRIGVPVEGTFRQGIADIDWFAFQGQADEWYEVHVSPKGDRPYFVKPYPPTGDERIGFPVLDPPTFLAKTTGVYTVEIGNFSDSNGNKPVDARPYTFTIKRCANHPLVPPGCGK